LDLNGQSISATQLTEEGKATLFVFWKSSNGNCLENLEALNEAWNDEFDQNKINLVAICIDCHGYIGQIKPLVNGSAWDFNTYVDINGDFRRALCIGDEPLALLFDEDKTLLSRYSVGFAGGNDYIFEDMLASVEPFEDQNAPMIDGIFIAK
jgi:hypothetical protein